MSWGKRTKSQEGKVLEEEGGGSHDDGLMSLQSGENVIKKRNGRRGGDPGPKEKKWVPNCSYSKKRGGGGDLCRNWVFWLANWNKEKKLMRL